MSSRIEQSIDLDVPVHTAYNQWTQFESFPHFMDGVDSVRQIDDTRSHWVTKVGGVRREFDAEVTEQYPDKLIAWTSTGGSVVHAGVVTFEGRGLDDTRVTIRLEWEPTGITEKVGSAMGAPERQVRSDATRFKEFIERRGVETGEWRGTVDNTIER